MDTNTIVIPWMNETAEDFYSWVDRRPVDDSDDDDDGDGDGDDDDEQSDTDGEEEEYNYNDDQQGQDETDSLGKYSPRDDGSVSITDSEHSHSYSLADAEEEASLDCVIDYGGVVPLSSTQDQQRHVSFVEFVEIREYAQTIGDHPCCLNGLPLTLDWYHSEENLHISMEDYCSERTAAYQAPRRLSYDERRDRLYEVSTHDEESALRDEEIGLVMEFLATSWSEHKILPPPMFEDLPGSLEEQQDDDADNDDVDQAIVEKQTKQLHRYHHFLRRSNCFME